MSHIILHRSAFLVLLTIFVCELLQTYIIPCTIYIPKTYHFFLIEFSYGIYFIGALCGLFFGLYATNKFGFRYTYLLGIKIVSITSVLIVVIVNLTPPEFLLKNLFYFLYPYRILAGFGASLTYGLTSALVINIFADPVKISMGKFSFYYTSGKIFSWSYIVLLLEMVANPFITENLFNSCALIESWSVLAVIVILWYIVAYYCTPNIAKTYNTQTVRIEIKQLFKNTQFIKLSICAGMICGIILALTVRLPYLIIIIFQKSTANYSTINTILISLSALGAFIAGFRFVKQIDLIIIKIVCPLLLIASIIEYLVPSNFAVTMVFIALIFLCLGFFSPVFNNLVMSNIHGQNEVAGSIILNVAILFSIFIFNILNSVLYSIFLHLGVMHVLASTLCIVIFCLSSIIFIMRKIKNNHVVVVQLYHVSG